MGADEGAGAGEDTDMVDAGTDVTTSIDCLATGATGTTAVGNEPATQA